MGGRLGLTGIVVGLAVGGCATPIEIPAGEDAGAPNSNDAAISFEDSRQQNNGQPPDTDAAGTIPDMMEESPDGSLDTAVADSASDAGLDAFGSDSVADGPLDMAPDIGLDVGLDVSLDVIGETSVDTSDATLDCDTSKIALSQQNPDKYELYQICIPENDLAAAQAVKAIDATLGCSNGPGVFASCPAGQVACTAELLLTATKEISGKTWQQLCELSLEAAVTKIAGGHWL